MNISHASAPTPRVLCLLTQSSQQPFSGTTLYPHFPDEESGAWSSYLVCWCNKQGAGPGFEIRKSGSSISSFPTCPSPCQQCDRMENIEQNFQAPQESMQSCTHSPDSVKTLLSALFHVGIAKAFSQFCSTEMIRQGWAKTGHMLRLGPLNSVLILAVMAVTVFLFKVHKLRVLLCFLFHPQIMRKRCGPGRRIFSPSRCKDWRKVGLKSKREAGEEGRTLGLGGGCRGGSSGGVGPCAWGLSSHPVPLAFCSPLGQSW